MPNQRDLQKIKELAEEFFSKMTFSAKRIDAGLLPQEGQLSEAVDLKIEFDEPQILIGERGQTLFEIQRLLKTILNKKLQSFFYLNLDINGYKGKKIEYLKDLAKESADQVSLAREKKALPPMPAYERRIIHKELSQRTDVTAQSQGEGPGRHIVICPH